MTNNETQNLIMKQKKGKTRTHAGYTELLTPSLMREDGTSFFCQSFQDRRHPLEDRVDFSFLQSVFYLLCH